MKHLFISLLIPLFFSCAYNTEEDLIVTICDPQEASFSKDIHPILKNRCTKCHGGSTPEVGLNYETYEGVLTVISAGKPENSPLYGAVSHTFGPKMPFQETQLSDCQIEKIKNWILNGAKND